MTQTQHTPGPYQWVAYENYPSTDLVAADGTVILQIYRSHGGGEMPDEAHQKLLAAAPELLAAHDPDLLDDLADDLDRGASPSRQSEIADDLRELVATIRAAIAKAQGGAA